MDMTGAVGRIISTTTFTPGDGVTHAPHQIASSSRGTYGYDARGDQVAAPGRTVTYRAFGLPGATVANGLTTTFAYDGAQSRVLKSGGASVTLTLGGLFEKRIGGGSTSDVFYVGGEGRSVAQITWVEAAGGPVEQPVQYLHDDHAGSVEAVTDASGHVAARQKFTPFGARVTAAPAGVRVGFDGLEQDDDLGLVNMRGRIYDAGQFRFLTADPIVSDPSFGQDFNRYSFARNNPLKWIDPTGYDVPPTTTFPPRKSVLPRSSTGKSSIVNLPTGP
jgi:RHS repeat-associated protein